MKVGIAFFSGTGNTAHVSRLIAQELRNLGALVDIHLIDSAKQDIDDNAFNSKKFEPSNYDIIGIGHPVLGFGPTPIVQSFVETFPKGHGRIFIFKSAADNHHINNSASDDIIHILEHKGYDVFNDFLYVMPCNWVISYQQSFNYQIIDQAKKKAIHHASEIITFKRHRMQIYSGWRTLAGIVHHLETKLGRKQFGKALRTTKNCTHCGRCIRSCPVGNIEEENKQIKFGENCLWCMRCVYNCSVNAIDAQYMNWCVLKKGYKLKNIVEGTGDNRTFITGKSRGYWAHFREYFN